MNDRTTRRARPSRAGRVGRALALAGCFAALAACSTQAPKSGVLSGYEGLSPRGGTLRTGISERRDEAALAKAARVALRRTEIIDAPGTAWLNAAERASLARELDAQLCFEFSRRYELAAQPQAADAVVRPVITRVKPTGRAGSVASAAAGYFIPGPLGLRVPGALGGLTVEAEMLGADGAQLAALVWNRDATPIGTDNPSLSRIGDALQFAAPFADTAAAVMSPAGARARPVPKPDPCAEYGPRFRPEGLATRVITGLYVPQASRARPAATAPAAPAPAEAPR